MSLDGGYPRIITISVPACIKREEVGDYVSYKVVRILNELGKNIVRRSVTLRFLDLRTAMLQFESHVPIRVSDEKREEYQAAEAGKPGTAKVESPAKPHKPKALPAGSPNGEE